LRTRQSHCAAELALWKATVPSDAEVERIPRVSHDQARELIGSIGGHKVYDVNPEGERILCDWAAREHGVDAIFVNGFPRKKPFNEYQMLLDNVEMFGLKSEGLSDYLSIFKYGCPPHGGFAIGLERLTQKVLGLANVKEACLFPRDRRRVRP
jgi:nondiscriminating aspartyl-tRNA synthetase